MPGDNLLRAGSASTDSRVAFAVDDATPPDEPDFRPGVGRGIVLRGSAQALHDRPPPALAPPDFFSREIIRIHPEHVVSWHIDPDRRGPSVLPGGRL